jgi:hypothetical protein
MLETIASINTMTEEAGITEVRHNACAVTSWPSILSSQV